MARTFLFLLLGSSAVCSLTAPLLAQPPAAETARSASSDGSSDIIVTARRLEERLQDVPISVTVYNQEQLDQRNIVNPSDLSVYTPSLASNRQYGTEKSSFSIRGFVQELGTQPSVAVYFADVVAPRAQGPTPSGNGTLPGTLFDLQNVQILKGPQGTLFGRNTTGGAVLFVPRKPTDQVEGYVEGTIGNYAARRFQAVVNLPLAETFKIRLGVDRMKRDGYLHNRSGIGPDDFADVDYWGFRASALAELTPTLENYLIATYNISDTHGHLPQVFVCPRNPATRIPSQFLAPFACAQLDRQAARGDGFYDVENDVPDPMVRIEQWQIINTTTWQASDSLTIKNIISYAQITEKNRTNFFGDRFLLPLSPQLVIPFRLSAVEPGPIGPNAAQYTFTEELQFQGQIDRLKWQAGGYFEISNPTRANTQRNQLFINCANAAALQCIPALGATSSVGILDQKFRFRNIAAYAQATYDITDQFSVTGGIRYTSDRIRARARNVTTRFLGAALTPFTSCSKNPLIVLPSINDRARCEEVFVEKSARPTWLIDLDYKPTDEILLYAKYARGYRQGTINLLPLSTALNTSGPEKVDTYELGGKVSFAGAVPGIFNVAVFYNDFTDQQLQANTIPRPGVFPTNVLVNAGKSRISGLEADLSVRPFEGLRFDAGYAYLDTKLQSFVLPDLSNDPFYSGVIPTATLGGSLAFSPKHRLTLTGTYTLPLSQSVGRLSVGATYTHTSKQYANRADDPFVFQVGFNPGLLPSTNLLNVNVDWTNVGGLPFDLSVFATNVTKEKYALYSGGLLGLGYDVRVIGEPRMYGARLRYKFGS
ncbi:TonB-dependent receptor [Sphingomonas tabacisoli]|uniref:TonB-dependent receptor n=1 Tax=Sphingomonas tabacisoli TaxID=2249466 RepID=A0ABW4I7R6_9SPHN